MSRRQLRLGGRFAVFAATGLAWGAASPAFRVAAGSGLSPASITAWQSVIAVIALLPLLALRRDGRLLRDRGAWGLMVVAATLNVLIPSLSLGAAAGRLDASILALLSASMPVIALGIGSLIERRRPPRPMLAGMAIGLAGVAIVVAHEADGGANEALAALLVLLSAASWAVGGFWAERVLERVGIVGMAAGCSIVALVLAAGAAGADGGQLGVPASTGVWISVLWLGLGASAFGEITAYATIGWFGPVGYALTCYLEPLAAVAISAILLGERLGPADLLAGALIGVGLALTLRPDGREGPDETPASRSSG